MPDWVEATCGLPLAYRSGTRSLRQLFKPARDHLDDRTAFLAAVARFLRAKPELINAWRYYSEDKRTAGPYFSLDSLEVGTCEASSGCRDVRVHADAVDACADFIYREAISVLAGARKG